MFERLQKEQIHAVHDEDLVNYLDGLGLRRKFESGELKCKFCRQTITFQNLHSMFPESGSIKLVCESVECTMELSKLLANGVVSL